MNGGTCRINGPQTDAAFAQQLVVASNGFIPIGLLVIRYFMDYELSAGITSS